MKKLDQIIEKLNKGRGKLEEIKKQYDVDSKKILGLRERRATLLADEAIESDPKRKEEIKNLSKQIDDSINIIEPRGPELADALQRKIQAIELERSNEELRLSFEKQKKLGAKIVELSGKLIENLGQANSTNEELNRAWTEYISLSKATSKGGIKEGSRTTRGSFGSLKFLRDVLNFEYNEGTPRPKGELPMGIKI